MVCICYLLYIILLHGNVYVYVRITRKWGPEDVYLFSGFYKYLSLWLQCSLSVHLYSLDSWMLQSNPSDSVIHGLIDHFLICHFSERICFKNQYFEKYRLVLQSIGSCFSQFVCKECIDWLSSHRCRQEIYACYFNIIKICTTQPFSGNDVLI